MNMTYNNKISMNVRVCDISGHLRPSGLLWIFQDASEVLTERAGVGPRTMERQGLNWIVARLSCSCRRLPVCEETVEITVWAGEPKMGIYPWQYRISDEKGEELVSGCALWVLSDSETRSMLSPRVPRLDLAEKQPPYAPHPWPKALKIPDELPRHSRRRVMYRDCDLNGHMNNACYLDWVCDLPEADFFRSHTLKTLAIDYRAESLPGEEVALDWALSDDSLQCVSPGRFLCNLGF